MYNNNLHTAAHIACLRSVNIWRSLYDNQQRSIILAAIILSTLKYTKYIAAISCDINDWLDNTYSSLVSMGYFNKFILGFLLVFY